MGIENFRKQRAKRSSNIDYQLLFMKQFQKLPDPKSTIYKKLKNMAPANESTSSADHTNKFLRNTFKMKNI